MRTALICDTHWGVRNDSPIMLDHMKNFIHEQFLPYIDNNNISTVIHLGDLVDRRKYINFNTARRLREDFLQPLRDRNLDIHFIIGNHDTYYKNTNDINAFNELLSSDYNIKTYVNNAQEVTFDGVNILFIPWICDSNREETLKVINETKAQIAMGHLELSGFEMFRGAGPCHGDDPSIFSRFDVVCSGHYHHRSSNGNIHYLGSPTEYTWSDFADPKGFHIFDTETREITFIENPVKVFDKFFYDDLNKNMDEVLLFDAKQYANKYVKVIIKNKTNPYWFDTVIERIDKAGVADMQVVEDHLHLDLEEDSDIINEAEDTMTILKKYLTGMNMNVEKTRVESIVQDLYTRAQNIE